jgi:hypothetical protein
MVAMSVAEVLDAVPRQETEVELKGQMYLVVSASYLDPEPMFVSEVRCGNQSVRKHHVPMPSSLVANAGKPGASGGAVASALQVHHLRFIRDLLSSTEVSPKRSGLSSRAGDLGHLCFNANGEVVDRAGEEHVPGQWLRAALPFAFTCQQLGEALALGDYQRALLRGEQISARFERDQEAGAAVVFATPAREEPRPVFRPFVENLVTAPEVALVSIGDGQTLHCHTKPGAPANAAAAATQRYRRAMDVLSTYRVLLRDLEPRAHYARVDFAKGTLVMRPVGAQLVTAVCGAVPDDSVLFAPWAELSDLARPLPEAPAAPAPDELRSGEGPIRVALEGDKVLMSWVQSAFDVFVAHARTHVGGAVIRNYLKRARPSGPPFDTCELRLDGSVVLPQGAVEVEGARAAIAWLFAAGTEISKLGEATLSPDALAAALPEDAAPLRPLILTKETP